jgi:hypothetical protein
VKSTAMLRESAIIARVETLIRHPAFAGSDGIMEGVLEDLQAKADARQISREAAERLRGLALASPHFHAI